MQKIIKRKHATKKASTGTETWNVLKQSLKRAADARDNFIVKRKYQILETEKKSLPYHNTNYSFKKYTRKVYNKPSHAENKDVDSTNNVFTTSDTKESTSNLSHQKINLLQKIDKKQIHESESLDSVDQIVKVVHIYKTQILWAKYSSLFLWCYQILSGRSLQWNRTNS